MDTIMDMLMDKKGVIRFLLKTIDSNNKMSVGLRKITNNSIEFKIDKLLEVVSNQSIQIKHMSLLLLIYAQSINFDTDMAIMLNKFGRGEEALKQMLKNKLG